MVRGRDTYVSLPTGYGVLICYGQRYVRSKPLTIAPKRQRARNDVTADPHLRRAASSSSESSDSDAYKMKFKRRERTHHSRSQESSFLNAPLLPSLPCPYSSRHEVKRGKHAHFDKLPSPIDDPSSLPV